MSVELSDINIRTSLRPGDIGQVIWMHGDIYAREYGYGIEFERYVAEGLIEFIKQFDDSKEAIWICEHEHSIVGFLLLMNRGTAAQLRYFLLKKEYRGIGLGGKLMKLFMQSLRDKGYSQSYLWTTSELFAAAALYRKYGFVLTEEKASTAFGKAVIEQRYECSISPTEVDVQALLQT